MPAGRQPVERGARLGQQVAVGDAGGQVEGEVGLVLQRAAVAAGAVARSVSATVVPRRPSVRIVPDRASSAQPALTVVGDRSSAAATERIGGSRSPGASVPSRTARLTARATPLAPGSVEAVLEGAQPSLHVL